MKTQMNILGNILAISLLTVGTAFAAGNQAPVVLDDLPLAPPIAWQIALQGDQALAQIRKDTRRALRRLEPMPLEQVVLEAEVVAVE